MTAKMVKLENRSIIRLSGADARSLMQGIITNDVAAVCPGQAVYAALLTPQGKYLFDMIILADGDDLLLDVEAARLPELVRRLMMYRLRAQVEIVDMSAELAIWAVIGAEPSGLAVADPRDAALGWRLVLPIGEIPAGDALPLQDYEQQRLALGVPDGSRDMQVEKYFWLETAAERLNGVSFTKGCYVGQELTARMKHRTNLKKCLLPVIVAGGAPECGTAILAADGTGAGEIRTGAGENAIAYCRLEYAAQPLSTDGKAVHLLRTAP